MNSDLSFFLLLVVFVGALMALVPHLTPRRYFFAITVPPDFAASDAGRASLRRYHAWVLAAVVLSGAITYALAGRSPNVAEPLAPILTMILAFAAFLAERSRVARHAAPFPAVREADLAPAHDHLPRWMALALPPFAALPAVALYLRSRWDEIPARFPVHWNAVNEPNRWADKTPHAVYGPLLAGGGLLLFMLLTGLGVFYGSRRGPQRAAVMKILVAGMYLLAAMFGAIAVLPLVRFPPMLLLVPTGIYLVVVIAWVFKLVRDPNMPADATPDACWYLGAIYYNREDPAVFVQKRMGFGYTFNMGNPFTWVLIGTLVAGAALLALVRP